MAFLLLLSFAAFLTLVSASYPFENSFKKEIIVISKTPKELLNCMAKCIDHRVAQKLDKCEKKFPSEVTSGINWGKKRRFGDHLVTMTKDELVKIDKCITQSKDRLVQSQYDICSDKAPQQALSAYSACSEKIVGETGYAFYDALAAEPELISEIFECIRENTVEYTPKERKQQISFETCARELFSETCGDKHSSLIIL